MDRLSKKENKEKGLMDTDNSAVIAGGEGLGEMKEGEGGINGDGWRLDLGWCTHCRQCTDDMLWNCVPETCVILLNSVASTNSIKKKKEFWVASQTN